MQACRALGLRFRVWLGFTSHSDTSHAPSSTDLATHKETDCASTSKGDIIAQCSRWLGRLLSSSGVQVLKHIPSLSAMSQLHDLPWSLHRTCGTSKHSLAWQHCAIQCRLHSTAPLRILTGSEEDMEPLKPWVHLQRDPSRLVIFAGCGMTKPRAPVVSFSLCTVRASPRLPRKSLPWSPENWIRRTVSCQELGTCLWSVIQVGSFLAAKVSNRVPSKFLSTPHGRMTKHHRWKPSCSAAAPV